MTEIAGVIAMMLAVSGVISNNRKLRVCFILWIISNILSGYIHFSTGVTSLLVRDILFTILAVEGWYKWSKK